MEKIVRNITVLLSLFLLPLGAYSQDQRPESKEPIKVVLNDWSSQIAMGKIVGHILTYMGYSVEYRYSSVAEQWGGLSRGFYHVQMEVWEGTMAKELMAFVSQETIVDAGDHDIKSREEWWYPAFVEALIPGLPDWRALRENFSLFATPETAPLGRYLAGPWEKPEEARIRALDLNFLVVEIETADQFWEELSRAERENKPIVMFNWSPNWTDIVYKGRFIEFPSYDPMCEIDPSWGVNPNYTWDCGNPTDAWIKKAVWAGVPDKWPRAYGMIKEFSFTNEMMAELSYWIDYQGMGIDAAVDKWLETYEKLWKSWAE